MGTPSDPDIHSVPQTTPGYPLQHSTHFPVEGEQGLSETEKHNYISRSGWLNEHNGHSSPYISSQDNGDGRISQDGNAHAFLQSQNDGVHLQSQHNNHATPNDQVKSEAAGTGDTPIADPEGNSPQINHQRSISSRMVAGCKRFVIHTKDAVCHSWINVLLVFVPIGIAAEAAHMSPTIIFALNAIAIVPLAGLLSHATESVASRLGDTIGALLNVTFGNAVELIIFIIALVKNEVRIVQASLIGSILANLLLILGMAFLLGGLRYREQIYNSTVTQMSACLLSLSVMSLLLPTAFHASFNEESVQDADTKVLAVSRGTSVVLLFVYILYLLFQLKSHAYLYESTPQEIIDEESHPGVLADMMNSSSSESSSSSSSSDSESSGSGSVKTAGKRIKRMIKHRRHRRSSAASTSTDSPSALSALSSPSASAERQDSYMQQPVAPRASKIKRNARKTGTTASPEGDADADDEIGREKTTRVRDFGQHSIGGLDDDKHQSRKSKKERKRRFRRNADSTNEKPTGEHDGGHEESAIPRVGFIDEVQPAESDTPVQDPSHSRGPFNMRGFSSRTPTFRPGLTKMLSNSVFATPPPAASASLRPVPTFRGLPAIRRTSSLPDLLNRSSTPSAPAHHGSHVAGNDPIPPHLRQQSDQTALQEGVAGSSANGSGTKPIMSRTAAVVMLLISTALVATCAEFMVDAIPEMIEDSPVSQAFIGLIILPIVGNAAEHVTAVTVAAKNKMDLAIGVAVGSSIQIALFVTPLVVLLAWCIGTDMSLYFNLFETVSLFVTAFVVNFLVLDGRSNYLEGSLLIAAYVIIALAAFYYPSEDALSAIGGAEGN